MNLTELKRKPAAEILEIAKELGVENTGRTLKQNTVFQILKKVAKKVMIFMETAYLKFYQMVSVFKIGR